MAVVLEANTEYKMQILSSEGIWGIETFSGLVSPTHLVRSSEYNVATTQGSAENPNGFAMVTTIAGAYSFAFDYVNHTLTIIYPDAELITLCKDETYELPHGYTFDGDASFIHNNRFYGTEKGQYIIDGTNISDLSHVAYSFVVGTCDYRIQSTTTYGTFYSNTVHSTTDSVSLYAHPSGVCKWQCSKPGSDTWQTGINNLQAGKSISVAGIYHTAFTSLVDAADITSAWRKYNGSLYVYDAAPSQIATFETITPSAEPNEYFDHTVVMRGANSASTTGVTMGDNINTCISYADGRYTAQTAEEWDFARYIYNAADNHFQRTILKLGNDKYLYVRGPNVVSETNFTYVGNNIFEVDFNAYPWCNMSIAAKNGTEYQYLLYKSGLESDYLNVLGMVTNGPSTLPMHVYYDFRTNRILHGWMPSDYTTSAAVAIDANLMVRRVDHTTPTPFAPSFSGSVTMGRLTYFIQEFQSTLSSLLADSYFYFSLPYDASMSDVIGMEDLEYKYNYTVQRYRGDMRAQYGDAYMDSPGYWANLKQTAALQAGRGYEIGIYDIPYPATGAGEAAAPSRRRLIFPSAATGFVVKAPDDYESTVIAANSVSAGIDEPTHANWNVVGTPGFVPVTPAASSSFNFKGINNTVSPNYLYTWNGEYNDFTVHNYQTFTFQPVMSYFMQYVGTIQWGANSTPAAVRARTPEKTNVVCDLYEILLNGVQGQVEDKTYVSFSSDASDLFEQHRDLYKIPTDNHSQLFSLGIVAETAFAAQDVTRDAVEIPLTLTLDNGEHTIALGQSLTTEPAATPLYLYDAEADTRVCLTDGHTYTFCASGVIAGRFFLRLYTSGGREVTTDIDGHLSPQTTTDASSSNHKFFRDGQLYIEKNGQVCTITGQPVRF